MEQEKLYSKIEKLEELKVLLNNKVITYKEYLAFLKVEFLGGTK